VGEEGSWVSRQPFPCSQPAPDVQAGGWTRAWSILNRYPARDAARRGEMSVSALQLAVCHPRGAVSRRSSWRSLAAKAARAFVSGAGIRVCFCSFPKVPRPAHCAPPPPGQGADTGRAVSAGASGIPCISCWAGLLGQRLERTGARCVRQGAREAALPFARRAGCARTRAPPGLSEDAPGVSRAPPRLSGVKFVDPRGAFVRGRVCQGSADFFMRDHIRSRGD
jgi:hypothetical protein